MHNPAITEKEKITNHACIPDFFLNFDTPLLYGFEFNDFRIVDEVIKENEKCRVLFFDEVQVVEGWEESGMILMRESLLYRNPG